MIEAAFQNMAAAQAVQVSIPSPPPLLSLSSPSHKASDSVCPL